MIEAIVVSKIEVCGSNKCNGIDASKVRRKVHALDPFDSLDSNIMVIKGIFQSRSLCLEYRVICLLLWEAQLHLFGKHSCTSFFVASLF